MQMFPVSDQSTLNLVNKPQKFPDWIVVCIVLLCVLPLVLNLLGINFTSQLANDHYPRLYWEDVTPAEPFSEPELAGGYILIFWEWSAFCTALFTVVFAFTHYRVTGDITTPILGTALFFSATMDAFRVLSFTGMIFVAHDPINFIPFTWVVSRMINVILLIAGCLPFVIGWPFSLRNNFRSVRFFILSGCLFTLMSFAIFFIIATTDSLPVTTFPNNEIIFRPWDTLPLMFYLLAGGIIFPRFHQKYPSLFSHALVLSVIPQVAGQVYLAFGSKVLFDNNFNISLYLKLISYLIPLAGLMLDYIAAYSAEVTLRTTQAKLRVARDVQQGLLPQRSPQLDGFDIAGVSIPADAAGGDFFDYVPMDDGKIGIVIADVSGHDISASILMAETRAYLRAMASVESDVSSIISSVNRFLAEDVQGRFFVTMFFACLDPKTARLQYAASGHEAYIIRDDNSVLNLESTSPPLGILDDGIIACGPETTLHEGDLLLMFTDGLTEALSPEREQFGFDNICKTVLANKQRPAEEIVQALRDKLAEHQKSSDMADDLTIVITKKTT